MYTSGKFVAFRTIAAIADHTDCAGYQDITAWPTLDDAIIGAHEFAGDSTQSRQCSSALKIKWAIAQAATMGERGNLQWRTVETIALDATGSRVLHIVSDKSGIPFDIDTDDFYLAPRRADLFLEMDRANLKSIEWIRDHLSGWGFDTAQYQLNFPNDRADMRDQLVEFWLYPERYLPSDEPQPQSTMAALGMFAQIPYMSAGMSNQIRNALISQLGYPIDVAEDASISWKLLDNGQYGWIAELANGAAHYWDDTVGGFVTPTPRVTLSPAQVDELLLQMGMFVDIVDEGMKLGDIQRCCNASEYVLAINSMLN